MPSPPIAGIYTPVPTFFKKDSSIDYESQISHARFLHENGIAGLVIMGSTGEAAHLTRQERASVIKAVHEALPQIVIIAGVAQNSVQDTIDEIDSVKCAGASYAVVLPSSYFGATIKQEGIVDFFTNIADQSQLPVMIYVYPGVSNNINVEPQTVARLSKHPNIVGTKLSYGDVAHHAQVVCDSAENFSVFTGLGQILLPTLSVGCCGTIDALSGSFPKLFVKIFEHYQAGNYEDARRLQFVACKGEEIVVRFGVIGIKRLIHSRGFGTSYLGRVPLNHDIDTEVWNSYAGTIKLLESTVASL